MSAYIPFDLDAHLRVQHTPPATSATPATLSLEESSSTSNDVEMPCGDGSQPSCYSLLLAATPAGKVAASSNRVATDTAPAGEVISRANTDQEALLETQSSESSKSSRGVEPYTHNDTTDMPASTLLPDTSPEKFLECPQVPHPQNPQKPPMGPATSTPFEGFEGTPPRHISKVVLPPCVVCGGRERWDHHGIWRCVVCWPPEAFDPNTVQDSAYHQ